MLFAATPEICSKDSISAVPSCTIQNFPIINSSQFTNPSSSFESDLFTIVCSGSISATRGLYQLIELSKYLQFPHRILVAGRCDSPQSEALISKAHRDGLVQYLGFVIAMRY